MTLGRAAREVLSRTSRDEAGNASVEFIGWTTVLVIPVVYLVMALASVQAAVFGVESAADAAARVLEVEEGSAAQQHAHLAARLALTDQRIDTARADSAMTVECARPGCTDGAMTLRVEVAVGLPVLGGLGIGDRLVTVDAERAVTTPSAGGGS